MTPGARAGCTQNTATGLQNASDEHQIDIRAAPPPDDGCGLAARSRLQRLRLFHLTRQRRDIGVIGDNTTSPTYTIQAPATVAPGVEFAVIVRTVSVACSVADGATLDYEGPDRLTAVIVPYDRTPRPGRACPDILVRSARALVVRFIIPGQAMIRVEGRRTPGDEIVSVSVPVQVTLSP